jgi:hypothetical protein
MDFANAITIVIAGELPPAMMHTLMAVSPALQTGIHAVLVGIHQCAWNDGIFDEGLDRLLFHIGQQMDHHLTTMLHHPKDRWSFLLYGPTPRVSLQSASTSLSALVLHHRRLAFMASNHIGFVALDWV